MARFKLGWAMARSRRIRGLAAAFPHLPRSLLGEVADDVHESRFRPGEAPPSPLWSDLARQPGSGPPAWNLTK
jgi:hypothetical protein